MPPAYGTMRDHGETGGGTFPLFPPFLSLSSGVFPFLRSPHPSLFILILSGAVLTSPDTVGCLGFIPSASDLPLSPLFSSPSFSCSFLFLSSSHFSFLPPPFPSPLFFFSLSFVPHLPFLSPSCPSPLFHFHLPAFHPPRGYFIVPFAWEVFERAIPAKRLALFRVLYQHQFLISSRAETAPPRHLCDWNSNRLIGIISRVTSTLYHRVPHRH